MKYIRKNLSPTKISLTIKVDKDDLAAVRKLTVEKLARDVKVSGFRSGKVPNSVAQKHIDQSALASQLLEDAVNKFVIEVIDTEDLRPLDRPKVDVKDFVPTTNLNFTVDIEILPEIKLGNYKSLKVKSDKVSVTSDEIDEVVERMRTGMAEKRHVNRDAKKDDEVWVDFEGKDKKGGLVPGASGKDYPLRLGTNTFIPGFEEGLVGHKADDTFELPLVFPKDYHHKPLAGAKVVFKITVKKVNEVILPELDKEFILKAGPFKDLQDLRGDIKRELAARKEQDALNEVKDNLLEQLVKTSEIPVPDILVNDQMDSLEKDTIQNMAYRGMSLDDFLNERGLSKEEWRNKDLMPMAVKRVQVGLALAELSKIEDIQVTREELDKRHAAMLNQYSDPNIRSQFDTPEARRDLANRVLTEKTVDRLLALNT